MVYFGTDGGIFYCLSAKDGTVIFSYRVSLGDSTKRTFSSPIVVQGILIFGAHDGNVYALNAITGKREWVYMDGDYIDSEPCYIQKHSLVVVGLQLGLFKKKSSIVALHYISGKKKWEFVFESPTSVYPVYYEKDDIVLITTNDGQVYAFKGKNGELLWTIKTDIAYTCAPCVDEKRGLLVLSGTPLKGDEETSGCMHICDIKNGEILIIYKDIGQYVYATPIIYHDIIIMTFLDKTTQAFSIVKEERKWKINLGSRIFSAPRICFFKSIQQSFLYVGTNNGHFFEIVPESGRILGKTIVTERITDPICFDEETETIFLATHANDLYALTRKK
jgi:outer membrane protein assembly factor BamB